MLSNQLILCRPLLLCLQSFPALGSFPMSQLFASGGQSIRPYISIRPSSEYSFRIDWFHRLVVQEALKSLLQHHSLKTSILRCSAFYIVQLSHLYRTTGKTVTLTRWTFVGKVMSLLFNTLPRFVITLRPRSERLLISCLQLPSAVILEPTKIKSLTVSIFSPSICHEVMGLDAMIFIFWMLSIKPAFSPSSRSSLVPLCFLQLGWYHPHIWDCYISLDNLDSSLCFI